MPKKIDLTNNIIGYWTVIREATKEEKNNKPGAFWLCRCQCGNEKIISGQSLRKQESKSCGCMTYKMIGEATKNNAEDLTGKVFGRLTILERDFEEENKKITRGSTIWKCQCECGNIVSVLRNSLLNESTKSCGCLRKEITSNQKNRKFINETGKVYGKLKVIEKVENKSTRTGIAWKCLCECGNEKIVIGNDLRNGTVSSCGCIGRSRGEWRISCLLNNANINFAQEYKIIINEHKLRYDFVVFNNKNEVQYLIEFDGKQHTEISEHFGGEQYLLYIQEHDKIKNQYCKENNIPLIRIPYTHLENLCLEDLQLETTTFLIC